MNKYTVLAKLAKAGYSADIDESFSNGRRVVAVFSEHKRQIKGILHGESDSRKTAFIEPEETIELITKYMNSKTMNAGKCIAYSGNLRQSFHLMLHCSWLIMK